MCMVVQGCCSVAAARLDESPKSQSGLIAALRTDGPVQVVVLYAILQKL